MERVVEVHSSMQSWFKAFSEGTWIIKDLETLDKVYNRLIADIEMDLNEEEMQPIVDQLDEAYQSYKSRIEG